MMALGLGAVIFVHELGHFLVAKACGVKCEKFYIGFDMFDFKIGNITLIPRALFKYQWGETEYGIGIVPLGGYVKMLGQDDNPTKAAEERERSLLKKEDDASEGADGSGKNGGPARKDDALATPDEVELDPRSYQAKSVPQRMAIISAGVIMNLIFAVIFATTAYQMGVTETAPQIGNLTPGSPAWESDIGYGCTVLSINGQAPKRGFRGIAQAVALNGTKKPMNIEFHDEINDTTFIAQLTPRDTSYGKGVNLPSLGISESLDLVFDAKQPIVAGQAGAAAKPAFQGGDRILKIGDEAIDNIFELKRILANRTNEELSFVVRHAAGKNETPVEETIIVPPNPMKRIGVVMEMGPIEGIQKNSPAAAAGFMVGDRIERMDGDPVGDPFTISARLAEFAKQDKSVDIEVAREGLDELLTLTVNPRLPITSPLMMPKRPIAIHELGVCFRVLSTVVDVEPGSSAAKKGIQAGDQILSARLIAADAEKQKIQSKIGLPKEIDLSTSADMWPSIQAFMNSCLPDSKIVVDVKRGDEIKSDVEIDLEVSDKWFLAVRGLRLVPKQETVASTSLGEAFSLGLAQTKEDCLAVYRFLQKLTSGELSAMNLGGPGTIAVVATSEAGEGASRLLMFLTLISANLAVVNFLPIPVLDGGHMVFLIYEAIFRKPVSERLMVAFSLAGFAFILCLMVFVLSLDAWRFML